MRARILVTLSAGALLLAASWPLRLDPVQFERNLLRWRAMSDVQREELRGRWEKYRELPEERQERLGQRFHALQRLRARAAGRDAAAVQAASTVLENADGRALESAVLLELQQREQLLRRRLAAGEASRDEVRSAAARVTRAGIEAFLGAQVRAGCVTEQERLAVLALPSTELLREALRLRKQDQLALCEPAEQLALDEFDPLDLLVELRDRRQQNGLLGMAGRILWPRLGADEQAGVRRALDELDVAAVAEILRPAARALLEEQGRPPDLIERVLSAPFAQMERELNALLVPPAVRESGKVPAALAPAEEPSSG